MPVDSPTSLSHAARRGFSIRHQWREVARPYRCIDPSELGVGSTGKGLTFWGSWAHSLEVVEGLLTSIICPIRSVSFRGLCYEEYVSLLSRKVIQGCVAFVGKRNTKIVNNLFMAILEKLGWGGGRVSPSGRERDYSRSGCHASGAGDEPEDDYGERPRVVERETTRGQNAMPQELEMSQKIIIEFFQLHSLIGGVRVCEKRRLKKKKCLARVGHEGQGSRIPDEEEERLARQEEADLQAGLGLFREKAYHSSLIVASLKAPAESVHSRPVVLIHVVDVEDDVVSPTPVLGGSLPKS
ncbi:hypothetical protein ACLOJK_004086 [Asimina triloba]